MTRRTTAAWIVLTGAIVIAMTLWARILRERFQEALTEAVTEALEMGIKKTRLQGFVPQEKVDLPIEGKRLVKEQAARLIVDHMYMATPYRDKFVMLDVCLQSVPPDRKGLFCEFGVAGGHSINYLAGKTDRILHGFDSFEGLPEDWHQGFKKGAFKTDGLPQVRENVKLHKGWFNESLPPWKKAHAEPILFIHMDADLYSSTKTVLDLLADRIVAGTVIQFDEYFNYPGWQDHEYKAFQEFVAANKVKYQYLAYNIEGEQAAVKILEMGGRNP